MSVRCQFLRKNKSQCARLSPQDYCWQHCQQKSPKLTKTSQLTGVRDLDYLILDELNDQDVFNMCRVNKYLHELCKGPMSDYFWKKRGLRIFGPMFEQNKPANISWIQWYKNILSTAQLHGFTIKQIDLRADIQNKARIVEIFSQIPLSREVRAQYQISKGIYSPDDPLVQDSLYTLFKYQFNATYIIFAEHVAQHKWLDTIKDGDLIFLFPYAADQQDFMQHNKDADYELLSVNKYNFGIVFSLLNKEWRYTETKLKFGSKELERVMKFGLSFYNNLIRKMLTVYPDRLMILEFFDPNNIISVGKTNYISFMIPIQGQWAEPDPYMTREESITYKGQTRKFKNIIRLSHHH